MARAQSLKEQVQTMSDRIKELKTALANVQNGTQALAALECGATCHGSLQDREPDGVEPDDVSKRMGTLAINSEGKTQYYGASAGPEVRSRSPHPVSKLLMPYSS